MARKQAWPQKLILCVRRLWVIRPQGLVRSIALNVTFLSLERGFDTLTVLSCPGGGPCRELKQYSDYDMREIQFTETNVGRYFSDYVECASIHVNTDELHLRFTSDGVFPKDFDAPAPLKYMGFAAVFLASSEPVAREVIGCVDENTTLTAQRGSIFAADVRQTKTTAFEPGLLDYWHWYHDLQMYHVTRFGSRAFAEEYVRRQCDTDPPGPECTHIRRGQSKWWVISPSRSIPGLVAPTRIGLALRDAVLEDALDVLDIYTRTGGVTTKVTSLTGMSPLRGRASYVPHALSPCSGCLAQCRRFTAATGKISNWYGDSGYPNLANCTWIIDTGSSRSVTITFDKFLTEEGGDIVTIEACEDALCDRVAEVAQLSGNLTNMSYTAFSSFVKLTFKSDHETQSAGFEASWVANCRYAPSVTLTAVSGSFSDGWEGSYPGTALCGWIIAPPSAHTVTVDFSMLAIAETDYVYARACHDRECRSTNNTQYMSVADAVMSYTSDTGIVQVVFYSETDSTPRPEGIFATWTSDATDETPAPEQPDAADPLDSCNQMWFAADEVLLHLKTDLLPTNTTGFWIEFFVDALDFPIETARFPSRQACAASTTRVIREWKSCVSYYGGTTVQVDMAKWWFYRDNWGAPPGSKMTWVLQAPPLAKSIVLKPPDLFFEKGRDFVRVSSCKDGVCSMLYKNMTGNLPYIMSFCDMIRNADEVRIEIELDGTNNFESRVDGLCYEWRYEEAEEETAGDKCQTKQYSTDVGAPEITMSELLESGSQGISWVISPGPDTKSITLDMTEYGLTWGTMYILSWGCVPGGECSQTMEHQSFMPPTDNPACVEEYPLAPGKNLFDCYLQVGVGATLVCLGLCSFLVLLLFCSAAAGKCLQK
jgi:hypothetical protein